MKRFHLHVAVTDLQKSVQFYSTLFGQEPSKLKSDYAKWMLEDPRLNFAISTRGEEPGVNHLGIQVDTESELEIITERLKKADLGVFGEGETTCCYAESKKAWVKDPSGIAWETYQTMADAEIFGKDFDTDTEESEGACCEPDEKDEPSNCCG